MASGGMNLGGRKGNDTSNLRILGASLTPRLAKIYKNWG